MTKELDKKIEKKEVHIYMDKDVCRICGETPELLSLYSILTSRMYDLNGVNDDMVQLAFKLGHCSPKEQMEIMRDKLKKMIDILDEE